MKSRLICLAVIAIGLAEPAIARNALVLSPSSPWKLDYAADKCRLTREFGDGDRRMVLSIDRAAASANATLIVAGEPIDSARLIPGQRARVNLRLGSTGERQTIFATPAAVDLLPGFVAENVNLALRPGSSETLTVLDLGREDVSLDLGEMAKPMAAMDACLADLAGQRAATD